MVAPQTPSLDIVSTLLEAFYGAPGQFPLTNPFELIVWDNVAYLVDDQRREEVYQKLRNEIGIDPMSILNCPRALLAQMIQRGGMQPERRAEKLQTSAHIAVEVGLETLSVLLATDPKKAKRVLQRFAGIGEPGADKILLFTRSFPTLAPDSNALRVLLRLGFGKEEADYNRTYRTLIAILAPLLPNDYDWLMRTHQLLRLHGQSLCKRSAPRCEICPLNTNCRWYADSKQNS